MEADAEGDLIIPTDTCLLTLPCLNVWKGRGDVLKSPLYAGEGLRKGECLPTFFKSAD